MIPIIPIVWRLGALAVAGYAAGRVFRSASFPARRDQRLEDGFDDLDEGFAYGRGSEGAATRHDGQLRLRREIALGEKAWKIDLAAAVRLKISRK